VPLSVGPWAPHSVSSRETIKRRLLAVADVAALTLVLMGILSGLGPWAGAVAAAVSVPVVLLAFHLAGLYNRDELRLGHTTLDEAPLLLALTGLLTLGTAIVLPSGGDVRLGGVRIALLWMASFGAVLAGRGLARTCARRILPIERCLVIGEVERAKRIRHKIATSAARAEVVGCLPMSGDDLAELANPQAIRAVAEEVGAHRLIIAGSTADADSAELVRVAKAVGLHITLLPQMFEVVGSAVSFDHLEGMTMLGVSRFGLPRPSQQLKRAFDLIGSTIGVVLISPILAAIAAAIRIDSKGPIFFRQTRVGRDGKPFSIIKFRSMVADAETRKDALRARGATHGGLFKLQDDPRITRVGKFLRKTSLDELPQLFNVVRGEMSLVGPRPLVVDEDVQIIGLHRGRLHLTPGMTGPWQLLRSRVPLHEMVEIDYLYVATWSLWHDIKILLRTVGHVARRGNV
jgi:exopolysaccharide biosynthesis polyprenyl glycosylphosphotransferase